MRVLLTGSGSSVSTKDVEEGYYRALKAAGYEVGYYLLDKRIAWARNYLAYQWRKIGRPDPAPTGDDIAYLANEEIAQRVAYYRPEWTIFVAGRLLHPKMLTALRHMGAKTALVATESPYDDEFIASMAPLFTVIFVNERTSVNVIGAVNPHTHYLAHAYDPARHYPGAGDEGDERVFSHDVVFVGSDFQERVRTLNAVDWDGIDLGIYGNFKHGKRYKRLKPHIRGGIVPNQLTAALYRKAAIGLNLYRTGKGWARDAQPVACAESLNPRAVELAACGVFTLSDYRPEVAETFGAAVPTFQTPGELGELIRYYLAHAEERRALAALLPGCVAGHTFAARTEQIMGVLQNV